MSDPICETLAKKGIALIDTICRKYELEIEMTTDFNELEKIVGKSLPNELRQDPSCKVDDRDKVLTFLCHYICFTAKFLELNSSDLTKLQKDSDVHMLKKIYLFIANEPN